MALTVDYDHATDLCCTEGRPANACVWAGATLTNFLQNPHTEKLIVEVVGFTATSGTFFSDLLGGALTDQSPNDAFYWISIGF